jgi:uncharacterized protein YfaS (alpha-2-macroglobulin family)
MIVLSKPLIAGLEKLLEPGYIVELEVKGSNVEVNRRPKQQDVVPITPTMLSEDERILVEIRAARSGEDPVFLVQAIIPPGFVITGIAGGPKP